MNKNPENSKWEALVQETGRDLLKSAPPSGQGLFDKNRWRGKLLSLIMENPSFKTRLFHFIDVLPVLETPRQILSHLNEYFKEGESRLLLSGLKTARLAPSLTAKIIKSQVSETAKIFITGRTVEEALKTLERLREKNLAWTLDFLEETVVSEKEALKCQQKYMDLMDRLIKAGKKWSFKELTDRDSLGPVPPINISVKITSLCSQIYPPAHKRSKARIKERLYPLFKKAVENFVFLNVDVERYEHKTLTLQVFKELTLLPEFKNYLHFGIVIQAYLKESFSDLEDLRAFAKKRARPFTVRLVKGAYWDSEVLIAKQKNWPVPVWTDKDGTDRNFEKCLHFLLENHRYLKTAVGSHNVRSTAVALTLHKKHPKACLEFQALYGMGDHLMEPLRDRGYCFRLYATIGELIPGMSYLVRRLLENTANQSFIQTVLLKNKAGEKALRPPEPAREKPSAPGGKTPPLQNRPKPSPPAGKNPVFINFPQPDFSQKTNRENFEKALQEWRKKLPLSAGIIIGGEEETSPLIWKRENPSRHSETIGQVFMADRERAERAVKTCLNFFRSGPEDPPEKRVRCLRKLAGLIAEKTFFFSALQVLETGKSWNEALADTAEAVDFCNYYAGSFEKLSKPRKTCDTFGESNLSVFEPVGVTAVIAPWNFPLAILTGMTAAPLVCGNPVIIKPAEQSALIAFQFAKLLLESGFHPESFAFLPGPGEDTGRFLVQNPDVSLLSFTGSFAVGAEIIREAGQIRPGQKDIKKCVVEMGGKNTIIVDESADLDEAVLGIISSAFAFQGQKCSACSRLIVLENIYERLMERFLPAVESLPIGPAEDPGFFVGPVVDRPAFERIRSLIQESRQTARILYQGKAPEGGYFIAPTVFLVKDDRHPLTQEEIFGPVLTVLKVKTLDEAFRLTNRVKYGLTAGFYSRRPGNIERFKARVEAGNIYINRNCTGALVERHPFGGRKMSGLGSKAGGPDSLKHFLHTKIISENTLRRGFSPEIFSDGFLENSSSDRL